MVDANVLVAAVGWPRFPYAVMEHAVAGDFDLVMSSYVIEEARRHILRLFPQLIERFNSLLEAVQYEDAPLVSEAEVAAADKLVRDVKDIPVALAAIKGQVDYLVTQDKDLLDPSEPVRRYLRTLLPGTFLREQMGWGSEDLERIRTRSWDELDGEA